MLQRRSSLWATTRSGVWALGWANLPNLANCVLAICNSGCTYVKRDHDASTLGWTLLETFLLIAERQNALRTFSLLKDLGSI
jgi:hypothetical protein